ncbi:unnamed protein product [Cuscuta campestris]|uniref:Retrotransposon Copia-like N-terminal domain-containing protein n=1 Tax=Cuscuta campestris TaxID=132261 RepID=A0A484LS25_9ASTE|nr:unnamed protein product [Cuscuta campestris]
MANNNNPFNLRYILENNKLSGTNFLDWEMNLRIVLNCERKLYILETDPPKTPDANARASELTSFKKYENDARDVKYDSGAPKAPRGHGSASYDTMLKRPLRGSTPKLRYLRYRSQYV